ncbi:uncharacterized protein LOC123532767 isoform X2 [Mercenaria mercenaria]|uniref:uncharacterized protein LOC123532767 isoform X2 n=1 Tax=Mercenaria mercenaria TaxID=6596 RepID=UPI00234F09B4|nr:uncharacterized protein LOC123532767 isoform X2 [Mercenaria mercenaria]
MKSLKSKNESFASVPVTKQIRRYGTRKQTQKVDEPRSTDLTSLRDSDGMDSTSSLEYAATSNVIDQELLASLKRQQELNSAGESEESDEDTSIRKSKIPKYAPSESVTELKLDTKQELHHAGESEEEDDSIRKSKIPKYDISNKRIKPLPSRTTIEKMWSIKGESEQSFHYYCHDICTFIKNKSDSILNVWPAYATDEANGMCFIVQTQEKLPELSDVDYPVYVRPMSQYSNENKIAMQRKEARDNMLEFKDVKHIQEVIDRHTSELFRCHSQLSVISGSGFRSKGYDEHDNSNHQIIPGNTVVMYVKIKGKVPLLEKLLPTELDGIPVDVREGGFESASLNATDCLPNLRMGCQIASAVGAGTLGGFIHHPMYGLCGTTCAHVVLSDAELKSSVTKNYGKRTWEEDEKIIRQPANRGRKVGRVTETFFKACEEGSCGIDLAVFQIEERPPNSGKFPTVKGVEIDMIYESGKMCEKSPFLHGRKVRKFGSATEFTEGVVNFPGAVCRLTHGNKEQTQLFMKVIDICSLDGPDFCLRGDSGALVFQTGVGRDSVCVGMLIGEVNGNGIALPISEVKEKLGVSEFEPFRL